MMNLKNEPIERVKLPWLKDPGNRPSIWKIVKDMIGKDFSHLSVPVYFNEPSSLLQKFATSLEYNYLLEMAAIEEDPIRRHALIAVHAVTTLTFCEKSTMKPFNPLLGETYENINDDIEVLCE